MSEALMTWQLGNAHGKDLERERIIAIIENAIIDSEGYCHADTVIALIKEENE